MAQQTVPQSVMVGRHLTTMGLYCRMLYVYCVLLVSLGAPRLRLEIEGQEGVPMNKGGQSNALLRIDTTAVSFYSDLILNSLAHTNYSCPLGPHLEAPLYVKCVGNICDLYYIKIRVESENTCIWSYSLNNVQTKCVYGHTIVKNNWKAEKWQTLLK